LTASDKRQAILQAAEQLFQSKRFDEVTLDEVAASASVGKGTIYLYFRDKEDLFHQLAEDGFREIEEGLEKIAASSLPVKDKLVGVGRELGDVFSRRQGFFKMLHSREFQSKNPVANKAFRKHTKGLGRIMQGLLEQGVRAGLLRPDLDLDVAECLFIGSMISRARRTRHGECEISIEGLVELFLAGAGKAV